MSTIKSILPKRHQRAATDFFTRLPKTGDRRKGSTVRGRDHSATPSRVYTPDCGTVHWLVATHFKSPGPPVIEQAFPPTHALQGRALTEETASAWRTAVVTHTQVVVGLFPSSLLTRKMWRTCPVVRRSRRSGVGYCFGVGWGWKDCLCV